MKKIITFLAATILLIMPFRSFGASGQIIATNSSTTVFSDFSAPAGEYINQINGYWSGVVGHIIVYTNGGSSGTILTTQDPQMYFSGITVAAGNHILRIGPDGASYLSAWTENGIPNDIIYNAGGSSTWNFTNFTSPGCEVITGFTSSSSGGWAYLNAVSSELQVLVSGGGTFCNSATLMASGGLGGTIYWQGTTSQGTSTTTPSISQTVYSSGTYYFREYNSCGWGPEGSATITVYTIDTLVSQVGVTLTANATGASYQWINCLNNVSIPGQTNQSFTATANGNYAVIVTQNSCSDTSSCHNITTVGIADNNNGININIFPNPSSGKFMIEMGNRKVQTENDVFEIYNMLGKIIYSANITQQKSHEIDLSKSPKGIYFVKITQGVKFYTERIVIQ